MYVEIITCLNIIVIIFQKNLCKNLLKNRLLKFQHQYLE
jgi:hypothetical protein